MALELCCLFSVSDRVSRATVSGCSDFCPGALLRVLLSVSVMLIGGHHVSVQFEDYWMYTRVRDGGRCRGRTDGVGHGRGNMAFVTGVLAGMAGSCPSQWHVS